MATNITKKFPSTDLGVGWEVHLFPSTEVWVADESNHIVGAFSVNAYVFTWDIDDTAKWTPTVKYKIVKSNDFGISETILHDNLMLGDIKSATDLATHIADTTTHGVAGAIVGISDAQTLTNKVIDVDSNTISNLEGDNFKALTAGKEAPAFKIKPGADDSILHIDTSSATVVEVQTANAAKDADRIMRLIAGSVDLQNDAAANIKITGLAAATATTEAVRFDEFDALDTRVTTLESGAPWIAPPPSITLELSYGIDVIDVYFNVEATERPSVRRWELYWSARGIVEPLAATVTAAELAALQEDNSRVVIRAGEGNTAALRYQRGDLHVLAIAFSSENVGYWDIASIDVDRNNNDLLTAGDTITTRAYLPMQFQRYGVANDVAAAEYADITQDATVTVKARGSFRYDANNTTLVMTFVAKIATDSGLVTLRISEVLASGTNEMKAQSYTIVNTAYPDSAQVIEMELPATLTATRLYEVEVEINGFVAVEAKLRDDFVIEMISQIPIA